MQVVIADTSPINYLLQIGHIEILPALFARIIVPPNVRDELSDSDAPLAVRTWMSEPPQWIEVRELRDAGSADRSLSRLDAGERAAILLALELHADLLLMDDRDGVAAARAKGLEVSGTLGLARAARQGLLNLPDAFERLKRTNFHYRQEMLDLLLNEAESTD